MNSKILNVKHAEFKKKSLEASIKKHQSVIDDLKRSIKELLGTEDAANRDESDMTQQSVNTEQIQKANAIGDQVSFANDEMTLLNNMLPLIEDIHDQVTLGSVVVTDKMVFFVSASIEQFEVDGIELFGLSTESPIYQEMRGKKKGDLFSYKEHHYTIVDLF
jgi:transcription elongation GreA/GreB family factor